MTTNTSLNNIAMGKKNNILPGIGYPGFFFHRFFLRVAPLVTFFFPSPSFTLQ